MDVIEKNISSLIKTQFPSFYQEEGVVFIQFVTEYFKWLESKTNALDEILIPEVSYVIVSASNTEIVGVNTLFTKYFSKGDKIALITNDETNSYETFTIKSVNNDTSISLSTAKTPNFSSEKVKYGTVTNQANPLFYARRFLEIKDIDETLTEFIVYFKKKYLNGLQFDTKTNTKRLVKHALDLYRSKGTERSVDLLFKAVFGVPADIYYPARDLFKLSDGQWYEPKYLEIDLNEKAHLLINKEIRGFQSGATAYVDSVVRKNISEKLIDVLYISSITGSFQTGEKINSIIDPLSIEDCPLIIGSLNEIEIDIFGTGAFFTNGQIINVKSNNGKDAKAKVSATQDITGTISINLEDGGYGYSNLAQIFVSDKILTIANVNINNPFLIGKNYVYDFETIVQPYASLSYVNSTGQFNIGDTIHTYFGNGVIDGTGTVLEVTSISTTNGYMKVSVESGDLDYIAIYKEGNTVSANLSISNGYVDSTASANVMGTVDSVLLTINNSLGTFQQGEKIIQLSPIGINIANGIFDGYGISIGNEKKIRLSNCVGTFIKPYGITGIVSSTTGNVVSTDINIGIKDTNPITLEATTNTAVNTSVLFFNNTNELYANLSFYNSSNLAVINTYKQVIVANVINSTAVLLTTNNVVSANGTANLTYNAQGTFLASNLIPVVFQSSFSNGVISFVSEGSSATASIANSRIYSENILFNTDFIKDYANTNLYDPAWGFPGDPLYNITSTNAIASVLSTGPVDIGKLSFLLSVNPGSGYTAAPLIRVYDPITFPYKKNDKIILYIEDATGSFLAKEEINQISTNGRGLVVEANSSVVVVENLRFYSNNYFAQSNTTSTTNIKGKSSGSEAKVTSVFVSTFPSYYGFDAKIKTQLQSYVGAIAKAQIIDSGFGYVQGETVTLESLENSLNSGIGLAKLKTNGQGSGFYRQNGGFLSSDKKLFDAYYYQEYSYEVRSSLILDKYAKMLKDVLHVAGTKMFGALVYDSTNMLYSENYQLVQNSVIRTFSGCDCPPIYRSGWPAFVGDESCFPFGDYNSNFITVYDCNGIKSDCINTQIDLQNDLSTLVSQQESLCGL